MDRTDLELFREMWRERIVWIGGWDPRMSASRAARRLGLSTSTVSERLRKWRETGFIHELKIFPHPALLRSEFRSTHVFTADPAGFEAIERILRLLPNLVHALEIETGFWTVWLDDGSDSVARSLALLATVPGVRLDPEIWPVNFPACRRRPLRRDWEMIALLARQPEASPAMLATRLKISTKTAARRLGRLITDNLVFFHPITDFSVAGGVVVNFRIQVRADADMPRIWRTLEQFDSVVVPQGDWADNELVTLHVLTGNPAASYIALYYYFASAAQVWERTRRIAQLEGVVRVVHQFVTRVWRGPSCVETQVLAATRSYAPRSGVGRHSPSR